MAYFTDKMHNSLNKARAAARFHQFSSKLLQIRFAEMKARYLCMTPLYRKPGLPRDIVIRVTERCFLKCVFCGQGKDGGRVDRANLKEAPMRIDVLNKIIDETEKWRIKPLRIKP